MAPGRKRKALTDDPHPITPIDLATNLKLWAQANQTLAQGAGDAMAESYFKLADAIIAAGAAGQDIDDISQGFEKNPVIVGSFKGSLAATDIWIETLRRAMNQLFAPNLTFGPKTKAEE